MEERNVTAHPVAPRDKALKINLDPRFYGTFAEIGAGQEVVRWFFLAAGAMFAASVSRPCSTTSSA